MDNFVHISSLKNDCCRTEQINSLVCVDERLSVIVFALID